MGVVVLTSVVGCLRVYEGEPKQDSAPADTSPADTGASTATDSMDASELGADTADADSADVRDASDDGDAFADIGPTTCDLYGGFEGVNVIADALVTNLLADCRIQKAFQALPKPSLDHLRECLALQLGSIWACRKSGLRVKYPGYDSKGIFCRDMKTSHAGQGISGSDFDAFVDVYKKTLVAQKVAAPDVTAVAGVIGSTRKDIAEVPDGGLTKPSSPCP